jgi:hypothetical protein
VDRTDGFPPLIQKSKNPPIPQLLPDPFSTFKEHSGISPGKKEVKIT